MALTSWRKSVKFAEKFGLRYDRILHLRGRWLFSPPGAPSGGHVREVIRQRPAGSVVSRFDTVSYSDLSANFTDFRQLVRTISRLYRSRFLQPNTHFAAFFEIDKIIKMDFRFLQFSMPLHRFLFQRFYFTGSYFILVKLQDSKMSFFVQISMNFCRNFTK